MSSIGSRVREYRPTTRTVLWAAAILYVEAMLVAGYVLFANVTVTDPLVLVYPWVWINASLAAVAGTTPAPSSKRRRRVALLMSVLYFGVLAAAGGLAALGAAFYGHDHVVGLRVAWPLPPGWGPAVVYGGSWIGIALVPYKLVGYAALAYLVYATALDAAGSAVAGAVGLFSCVSCAWPIVGSALTSAFGGASVVTAIATEQPYGTSTLVFLSAVLLLYYRPVVGRRASGE